MARNAQRYSIVRCLHLRVQVFALEPGDDNRWLMEIELHVLTRGCLDRKGGLRHASAKVSREGGLHPSRR